MTRRLRPDPLGIALILSGLLFILSQSILPGVERLGPVLRYGYLGFGSTQQAAAQLEQEVQVIRERIQVEQLEADASSTPHFAWPTPGWGELTSPWGQRSHPILGSPRQHLGIDIGAPTGAEVVAMQGGKVILSDRFTAHGRLLVIDHGGRWASVYAHLSQVLVTEGEQVEAGQVIGSVGATGRVTGPHLHLELHREGEPIDPLLYTARP